LKNVPKCTHNTVLQITLPFEKKESIPSGIQLQQGLSLLQKLAKGVDSYISIGLQNAVLSL
jgi:predicted phage-related endonuclease